MERIYDGSLVSCPNTGLRYTPADYKTVLDNFYSDVVSKKRNPKVDQQGRFLTADQFISGELGSKKKFDGTPLADPRLDRG